MMSNLPVQIHLKIRCQCNLNCWYCVAKNTIDDTIIYNFEWLRNTYQKIISNNIKSSFECGGSEPTLHPQIKRILDIVSDFGSVSIPTNNTIDPDNWLPVNKAEKFFVRCALHPYNEEKFSKFKYKILKMKSLGAKVACIFVATPNRLKLIKYYYDIFNKIGILFKPIPFDGIWNDKKYPQSYTENEKDLIFKRQKNWYERLKPYMFIRNFKGIPCLAGKNLLYISPNNVKRCLYDRTPLYSYDKIRPCNSNYCGCGLFLKELNTWMKPNNNEDNESFFISMKKRYFDLMIKYNKLDKDKAQKI